jgi:hypothetical protein
MDHFEQRSRFSGPRASHLTGHVRQPIWMRSPVRADRCAMQMLISRTRDHDNTDYKEPTSVTCRTDRSAEREVW